MDLLPLPLTPSAVFRRARLLSAAVALTFVVLRVWLTVTPNADLNVLDSGSGSAWFWMSGCTSS